MGTSVNSNEPCDKETNDFLVLAQEKNICFLVIGRMPAMMSSEAAKNHGSLENWELRRANARDDEKHAGDARKRIEREWRRHGRQERLLRSPWRRQECR